MEKINKKDFFSFGFLSLLIINLFVINFYFLIFFVFTFSLVFIIFFDDEQFLFLVAIIFGFFIQLFLLPVLYSFLERKSSNPIVQKFIFNLKNSKKWKVATLFLSALFPFYFFKNKNLFDQLFLNSGFLKYLILFIWWEIQKYYEKRKKLRVE